MDIFFQFILGFFATLGFAIYFNVPIKSLVASCITGATGWAISYIISFYLGRKIIGTFFASFIIGILGELFAVKLKKPATVFIVPGITPLVPGAGTYYTMLYLIQEKYSKAMIKGTETLFVAAAIAIGIIFSSVLVEYFRSSNKDKLKLF